MPNADINVLAIVKGEERYVFLYDDDTLSRAVLLRTLGRFAENKELSFSWFDAATLSQKIKRIVPNGQAIPPATFKRPCP